MAKVKLNLGRAIKEARHVMRCHADWDEGRVETSDGVSEFEFGVCLALGLVRDARARGLDVSDVDALLRQLSKLKVDVQTFGEHDARVFTFKEAE